jgi:membrane protease YdiL (CAAX protease family)
VLDPAPESPPYPPPGLDVPRPAVPVERLGALIEVFLCSGLPTQLLVFQALTRFGMSVRGADGNWSPAFIVALALIDMVLVLALIWLFLRAHREPLKEFVLGPRRLGRETLLGIALIPAALVLVVLVLAVILAVRPGLHNVPVNPFERMLQTPRDAAVFAVVVMLAGGVREEVQRGFIIRRFDQYLGGGPLGILAYSVVFGLGHIEQGYAAAIATGTLGAAWGLVYWRRQSIVAPMISHAGFNLAQLVKYVSFLR